MPANEVLLILAIIVIIALVALLIRQSLKTQPLPSAQDEKGPQSLSTPPQASQPPSVHIPAPIAQQELEMSVKEPPTYEKRKYFFSYAERQFYQAIREALCEIEGEYEIFAKVRLGDLIYVSNEAENRRLFNSQLWYRHIDFVICEKSQLMPVLAIELDDSSHNQYDRQERDQFKTSLFKQINFPLERFVVQQSYSREELIAKLGHALATAKANHV